MFEKDTKQLSYIPNLKKEYTHSVCRKQPLFNSLSNDKFIDWSKLKAFADDKSNLVEKSNQIWPKFVLGRIENIVGKGENAGFQHFLLFPQCFQTVSILGSLKVGIVW